MGNAVNKPRKPEIPTEDRIRDAAHHEFVTHGFAGARIDRIVKRAKSNPRMIYHHFGGKAGLYLAVLEDGMSGLREREMMIDYAHEPPVEGLLKLYDFLNEYFRAHPDLVRLLTNENIEGARHLKDSDVIGKMSSPVLEQIGQLLARGEAEGCVRPGIDALTLYVQLVALTQFHISNMHTLSTIFDVDIGSDDWRNCHRKATRTMVRAFLEPAVIA
jgi:AcrR family transcriptional regulator